MVQDFDLDDDGIERFDIGLLDNQQQRLPCVLVLDSSYSMTGPPIDELNKGLLLFENELKNDEDACKKVQIMVIKCNGNKPTIVTDWTDAEDFTSPSMVASGNTPLGEACQLAAEEIEKRKKEYNDNGVKFLKPWLFIISDGEPNDVWRDKAAKLKQMEDNDKFLTFVVAVEDAKIHILQEFSTQEVKKLNGIEFTKLFQWISASVKIGSRKINDGHTMQLPPVDWSSA